MTKLIYCPVKASVTPYHLKSLDYNFYSIEEIVYFFMHNEILIDESIMDDEFVYWLSQQNDKLLADKLHQIVSAKGTLFMFMEALLNGVNTLTSDEKTQFLNSIKQLENKNELGRRKIIADQMISRGKYESAILEYRRILESVKANSGNEELLGKIYHNLGCCYSYLFFFDNAKECFMKAYSYNNNQASIEAGRLIESANVILKNEINDPSAEKENILHSITLQGEEEHRARMDEINQRILDYIRSTV